MELTNYELIEFLNRLTPEEMVIFIYSKVLRIPFKKIERYRNIPQSHIYRHLNKIHAVFKKLDDHKEMIAIIQTLFERDDLV